MWWKLFSEPALQYSGGPDKHLSRMHRELQGRRGISRLANQRWSLSLANQILTATAFLSLLKFLSTLSTRAPHLVAASCRDLWPHIHRNKSPAGSQPQRGSGGLQRITEKKCNCWQLLALGLPTIKFNPSLSRYYMGRDLSWSKTSVHHSPVMEDCVPVITHLKAFASVLRVTNHFPCSDLNDGECWC